MKSFDLGRTVGAAVLAACVVFAATAASFAQGAPAGQPAAPVALSASHLAAAIDVVRLSGMSRSIDVMVPETVARARLALTKMHPQLAGDIEKSIGDLKVEFAVLSEEAVRVAAASFGRRLPEADLNELKKFYTSDIGKKFVAAQPAIIEDMYRSLDQFSGTVSQVVIDKIRDEMKKKGHTL